MVVWLLDALFGAILGALSWIASGVVNCIGFDFSSFETWFSTDFLNQAYSIICAFGYGLVIVIMLFQFLKVFGLPIGIEADSPLTTVCRGGVAIVLITFSKSIFDMLFTTFTPVFDAICGLDTSAGISFFSSDVVGAGISMLLPNAALFQFIIFFVFMVIVFYNFIKYTLELIERYLMLCFIAFTAPLGISTFASKSTENIFNAWVRMSFTQYIVYLINILGLKMFMAMVKNVDFVSMFSLAIDEGEASVGMADFILQIFAVIAFLKMLQKLDMLLGRLGLEVGNAGGPLFEDMMVGRMALGALTGHGGGGGGIGGKMLGGAAVATGGGGILGAVNKFKGGFSGLASKAAEQHGKASFGTMAATAFTAMGAKTDLGKIIKGGSNSVKGFKSGFAGAAGKGDVPPSNLKKFGSGMAGAAKGAWNSTVFGKAGTFMGATAQAANYNRAIGDTQVPEAAELSKILSKASTVEGGTSNFGNLLQRNCTDNGVNTDYFRNITSGMDDSWTSQVLNPATENGEALASSFVGNGLAEYHVQTPGGEQVIRVATNPLQMANEQKRIANNPGIAHKQISNFHTGSSGAFVTSEFKPKATNSNPNSSGGQGGGGVKKPPFNPMEYQGKQAGIPSIDVMQSISMSDSVRSYSMTDDAGNIVSYKTYTVSGQDGNKMRYFKGTISDTSSGRTMAYTNEPIGDGNRSFTPVSGYSDFMGKIQDFYSGEKSHLVNKPCIFNIQGKTGGKK